MAVCPLADGPHYQMYTLKLATADLFTEVAIKNSILNHNSKPEKKTNKNVLLPFVVAHGPTELHSNKQTRETVRSELCMWWTMSRSFIFFISQTRYH